MLEPLKAWHRTGWDQAPQIKFRVFERGLMGLMVNPDLYSRQGYDVTGSLNTEQTPRQLNTQNVGRDEGEHNHTAIMVSSD